MWHDSGIDTLPYFDAKTIADMVSMPDAIAALRTAFAVRPNHAPRTHQRTAGAEILTMPAAAGNVAGAKMVTIQPRNQTAGRPIIQGIYVLFDALTGCPVALLDGAALTSLRTPAISAVATDALARPESATIGIWGTGPQAFTHPLAVRAVRPAATKVVVAGRSAACIESLIAGLAAEGFDATAGSWADAAACDIVCGCTRSDQPLVTIGDIRPGTHLNLVGSYRTDLREVGSDVVTHSTVVVDDLEAAKAEAGELTIAVHEGLWSWSEVAGDLTDVASGQLSRSSTGEITLFKSVGLAVEDLVIAQLVAHQAGLLSHSRCGMAPPVE